MMSQLKSLQIGFIGLGVMGKSMVRNLRKAGYSVAVYTRTRAKAEDLLAEGAVWKDTVAELARTSQVVITMVGYPQDVSQVYLEDEGIISNAPVGAVVIDMTTSSPALAREIYQQAKARQVEALDAPVSGGDIGAREGRLTIMVGGAPAAFERVKPLFQALGQNIILQGGPGAGQHTKMCNQIAIAAGMMGVCEAIAYAGKAGLDPATVLKSIEAGAAGSWSLSNLGPRIITGNFAPGFYVKHFIKDMGIALESARELGLDTPGLALAKTLYEKLAEAGEENSGTQALFKLYIENRVL